MLHNRNKNKCCRFKADDGIDIIINRVGPMVGPRMLGLRKSWKVNQVVSGPKPGTGAGHWAMMPKNTRPKGQLISKCSFCVFKSTKKPTKFWKGSLL